MRFSWWSDPASQLCLTRAGHRRMETRLALNMEVEPEEASARGPQLPALLTGDRPLQWECPSIAATEGRCDLPLHAGPSHGEQLPQGPPRSISERKPDSLRRGVDSETKISWQSPWRVSRVPGHRKAKTAASSHGQSLGDK